MSLFYSIFAIVLLFICISGSVYFSLELYNNLSSYVDVYIESSKKLKKNKIIIYLSAWAVCDESRSYGS